jgi:tripartite-type tricarboxylate transporter receptor subunit TctC
MTLSRRHLMRITVSAVAALPVLPRTARAFDYPIRPIELIVGFAAGGPTDIVGRLVARWLSERLGQQVVVENRPGAGSNLGTERVVEASPDGYTLLLVTHANAFNSSLYDNLNFNFLRDIAPVAGIMRVPDVMEVNPSVPVKSPPELIAYAKDHPGKLYMATGGIGSAAQVYGELFKAMAGIDLIPVHYRGTGPALVDLMAGQVQVLFDPIVSSLQYIKAGKVRALAVTSASPSEVLPDLPTMGEFLPGYEASAFYGVGAPRNTPPEIIDRINKEINAGLSDTALKARLSSLGGTVIQGSPGDFGRFISNETARWGKVIRDANIKSE